jgi:hypothetical protein
VHAHGKRFFTDWDDKDWAMFDSFCIRALQYHLAAEPPDNTIIGESKRIQFKQRHGEEMFEELCNVMRNKADLKGKYVVRESIIQHIRDSDNTINAKNAGGIARAFLKAMGAGDIKVSTIRGKHNAMMVNVYIWEGVLDL